MLTGLIKNKLREIKDILNFLETINLKNISSDFANFRLTLVLTTNICEEILSWDKAK